MSIQKWSDQIWFVAPDDEPNFSEELSGLRDEATKVDPMPHLIVDLAGVNHLNSSQITQLLRVRKLVKDNEVSLRLAGPSDSVWAIFLTTGLDKIFRFSSDISTALAELQMKL